MATKSSRRKLALATLQSINRRRMAELVRLRKIRAHKRLALQVVDSFLHDEVECLNTIDSLRQRIQYEVSSNSDFLSIQIEDSDEEEP